MLPRLVPSSIRSSTILFRRKAVHEEAAEDRQNNAGKPKARHLSEGLPSGSSRARDAWLLIRLSLRIVDSRLGFWYGNPLPSDQPRAGTQPSGSRLRQDMGNRQSRDLSHDPTVKTTSGITSWKTAEPSSLS